MLALLTQRGGVGGINYCPSDCRGHSSQIKVPLQVERKSRRAASPTGAYFNVFCPESELSNATKNEVRNITAVPGLPRVEV